MSSPSLKERPLPMKCNWKRLTSNGGELLTTGGPKVHAIDQTEPIMPWYMPLSLSGTRSERMISVSARMPPAPAPWTADKLQMRQPSTIVSRTWNLPRPPMSIFIDWAPPHKALPRAKSKMHANKIDRRPNILAKCADMGIVATDASVYPDPIHANSAPWKSATIVGRAVATDVYTSSWRGCDISPR